MAIVTTAEGISIHALLAESDAGELLRIFYADISIHALLAESDFVVQHLLQLRIISIHALLAESDTALWLSCC